MSFTINVARQMLQFCESLDVSDNPFCKDGRSLKDEGTKAAAILKVVDELLDDPNNTYSLMTQGQLSSLLNKILVELPILFKDDPKLDLFSFLKVVSMRKGKKDSDIDFRNAERIKLNVEIETTVKRIMEGRLA